MGDQTILNLAREVSEAIEESGAEGGIIGGIAVFLHGYERTTTDIDVYSTDRPALAERLRERKFVWTDERRQFEKSNIPVQLLAPEDKLPYYPTRYEEVQGVRTVTLGELITMKLSTGTKYAHRLRDWADVADLVQTLGLTKSFTPMVGKAYRKEFKMLVDSIDRDRRL